MQPRSRRSQSQSSWTQQSCEYNHPTLGDLQLTRHAQRGFRQWGTSRDDNSSLSAEQPWRAGTRGGGLCDGARDRRCFPARKHLAGLSLLNPECICTSSHKEDHAKQASYAQAERVRQSHLKTMRLARPHECARNNSRSYVDHSPVGQVHQRRDGRGEDEEERGLAIRRRDGQQIRALCMGKSFSEGKGKRCGGEAVPC